MAGEFGFGAALGLGTEDWEAGAKGATTSGDKVTDSAKRMGKASDSAGKRLKGAGDRARDASGKFVKTGKDAGTAGKRIAGMGRQSDALGKQLSSVDKIATSLFAGFTVTAFTQQMMMAHDSAVAYADALLMTNTLVGVSSETLAEWRPQIGSLAVELGRLPQEMAEAVFFITSGGQRGSAALDLLAQSGKAAAIGLGATKVIADAGGSALNAYGEEALDAETAVNVLFETVREGKLAADALAPSLGKVIGLASQMGVEFGEVGAFLAAYTRLGGSAEEATFSLSSILTTILKPADSARERLEELGLSVGQLRRGIREEGLAKTLVNLAEVVGDNEEALGEVIPEVRALRGFLAVAGAQAETYLGITERLTDENLELAEAFRTVKEESPGQKLAELRAEIELHKIEIGDKTIPVYAEFLAIIRDILRITELGEIKLTDPGIGSYQAIESHVEESRKHWEAIGKTVPEVALETARVGTAADWYADRARDAAETEERRLRLAKKAAEEEKKRQERLEKFLDLLGRMERRITIKIEIEDAQVQALLESLGSMPTMGGQGGAGTSQEILDRRRAEAQEQLTDQWVDLQAQAAEESAAHQVDTWGEAVSTVGLIIENEWQDMLAHVLGGALDAIFSGGDIGAALSGGLGDIGGHLGGIFGSAYGPLGSMLGSALGEQAGQIVGDLVGDVLGFGESLEDAYSTVISEGGQLLVGVQTGGGEAAAIVDDILSSVLGAANQIVGSLGGAVEQFLGGGLALQVNVKGDEIEEIKAYIDGVEHVFATVDEAIQGLIGHVLSLSATSGLDPEVEAILRNAAGKPLDQVNAEVAAGVRVAVGRIGQDVASYRDQIRLIFEDFSTVMGAGGDAMAGTLGRLRDMWDAATGQQKSAEEIFESRKAIILAEIDLEIARLQAEQRALQAEADQAQVGIDLDQARLLAHHEILRGEAHIVEATADFAGQLVAIANMISELELLSGEIAATPFRPPSIPGITRPSGGAAGPVVDVEAIEREIALAEARGAGNDALTEALLLEEEMAGLRERGWTQEQIDRLLAAQAAQEALAAAAAELARQEEEAARQAEALRQQIGDLFGQLGSFGDGRSGASGQIQDAIDQMDAMWAALNELRPEDLSPEELAAASEQIQNAIAQTAEEISRVGADLVTGTLAGALRTAISRTDDPRERLRLQEELFELERALGIIKQQAAIAELAQVEALMRSQGLWTAELEAQSNRAIELLSEPWPDFVADITGAGEDFATSVGSAATAAGEAFRALVFPELIPAMSPALTPAQVEALYGPQIGALLARIGATEVDVGAKTPFDLMREEVDRLAHLFPAFGLVVEDVMADIDALEVAELAKRWADAGKGLDSFLDELEFGELSGKSGRVQAQFAQAQVRSLMARAQAGDVDALSELGQAGPDFWRLAAGSVNPVDLARIRQELLSQGRLATSGPFGDAGSGDQGADFSRIADQLGGVKRATEDTTGAVTTSGGEIVDEISGLRADLAQHRADHHAMSTPL